MNSNGKIILFALIGLVAFQYMKNKTTQSGLTLSTSQKRNAINIWWETFTPATVQANDNGRFEDIINNITGTEIDSIYDYIFNYVQKGLQPTTGTPLAQEIQIIKTQYSILN